MKDNILQKIGRILAIPLTAFTINNAAAQNNISGITQNKVKNL